MLNEVSGLFENVIVSPPEDRRLTQRLLNVWARTSRGRFPSWEEMQDADLGEDWNWSFVVDLERSAGFPYFIYLGENLAKLSDVYLSGANDWTMSLLDMAAADVNAAVAEEAPYFRDDELILCDGRKLFFRSVTAPLADDGENITHVFGVSCGRFA